MPPALVVRCRAVCCVSCAFGVLLPVLTPAAAEREVVDAAALIVRLRLDALPALVAHAVAAVDAAPADEA